MVFTTCHCLSPTQLSTGEQQTMLDSTDIANFTDTASYRKPTARQREIVDHLVSTGDKIADAAEVLGLDRCNIYRELRKPHVKYYMYTQLVETLTLGSVRSVKVLNELLDHKSGYIRLEASKEHLNRVGLSGVQRKQVSVNGAVNVQIDLT